MDEREQQILYAFLHDIDVFLGDRTTEFAQALSERFSGIDATMLFASGEREPTTLLKDIGEPDRLLQSPEKLTSIFSKVSLPQNATPEHREFPRRILRFDESFPKKEDEDLQGMRQGFLNEVHSIPQGNFFSTYETLASIVEKYTAFFPTPHATLDGVSLFDHLRLSAAMAACYQPDPTSFPYRVVAGELLGLEDFIYNIATPEGHTGQAKGLRGRSFYCLVLTYAMSHFFLHKLDLPITNLLWTGGELFAFLAPNTEGTKAQITAGEQAVNQWFLREHDGRMFLGLAQVQATTKDLVEDYTATFKATYDQLQQANRQRFASLWNGSDPNTLLCFPSPSAQEVEECRICQKDFPQGLRLDRWKKEPEDDEDLPGRCPICQLQYKLGSFLPKVRHYVEIRADAALARELQATEALFLDFLFEEEHGPTFYWVFPRERRWGNEIDALVPRLRHQAVQAVRVIWPNDTSFLSDTALIKDLPPATSLSFSPIANTVPTNAARQVLDFKDIAEQSDGAKYLAALKMDVDNFTRVFTEGLVGGATSLAHRMTLSCSFSYFFLGYINTIAHRYRLRAPDGNESEGSSQLYTVFVGGDDLFLLGPWDAVIDAADQIREKFMHYTDNPSNLTISAGITYFKPTFPIRRFAQLTSDALDGEAKSRKDALSLFGEVLYWDRNIRDNDGTERLSFTELYKFAKNLAGLVERERTGEGVSHSFLMNLLTLKRTSLDRGKIDWKWKLLYLLAQAGVKVSGDSEKWKLLSPLGEGDGKCFRSLEMPLMWVLLKTRRG
jgi:CRISPR-associated protein Csm1